MTSDRSCPTEDASPNENAPSLRPPLVAVLGDFGKDGDQIAWLLRISGYHAAFLPDVASAEMFLAQHRPPLVVVHPRRDSFAELRVTCPETAVIIVSDDDTNAHAEIKSGLVAILPLPFDAGKFCSAVYRAMNRPLSSATD
jgi:hypothetical protein